MDLTKHRLVPKHVKVPEAEKSALLKEHHAVLADFPKIIRKDPAIVKLSVKTGDIIRIERPSKTAGHSYYYRVVVDG